MKDVTFSLFYFVLFILIVLVLTTIYSTTTIKNLNMEKEELKKDLELANDKIVVLRDMMDETTDKETIYRQRYIDKCR